MDIFGNCKTSTWFHDSNLKIKSIQNEILAVTTIGRKYILDFGLGYTREQFFMANTPVTTQLWQSGRPLNAEVLRTTKVKTTLFAYPCYFAPQCIPDISSFKALPFRDTESRFTTDSSVISSRFSSSFTSSSSKIIIITSIFSSKMDKEHVGASLIVSLSMASLFITNVFSFSSTSYSSQPSDYITCSPSGIDDQPVAEPSGYTPVGSLSSHSGCITSGLDAIGSQSSPDESQSTNASSRFVTKLYISFRSFTYKYHFLNDAITGFGETTLYSISSSRQYSRNSACFSSKLTVLSLTTTITQSTSDLISQSSKYIFSVSSRNNTQFTSKEALNTFFDSSASTKLTNSNTYKPSLHQLNSESTTRTPFCELFNDEPFRQQQI
ncbi:BAL_1a_G0017360.mRNA.1.CDS.1 [Saccharomyces cerevisiae]|nr:BAL_1a_G0017360.mRNA.1.CDS.1 [Saccharomyces cerevisiae]CAI7111134.1 BAL_1a_G0017360.mRNA.1.CDS.1 [Saccharomyces cerevisiae]